MSRLRATFPWFLLAASVALNLHLWRRDPTSPSAELSSNKPSSVPGPASSPQTTNYKLPTTSEAFAFLATSRETTPLPTSSTLASTATRSHAFHGYADLLAEEVQTPEQLASLHELLARWVATAPANAATWLAQHDDAPFYDPAARHVALHLVARQNFDAAATWADLIRDPALREEARDALIAESYRAKKIDAHAVRLSGLTPAHIEAILNGSRLD